MTAYHICRVSQDRIDRGLYGHQPASPVGGLQVLLQVGVVVEGHPALVAHDVLRLQMHFVDVLREVRVLALAVGAFGLGDGCDECVKTYNSSFKAIHYIQRYRRYRRYITYSSCDDKKQMQI